jgi:hypothetical protein
MVSEPGIYSRRLASGLRTQKRERETITLTLEKRSVKRGGLTFSSAPTHEDEVLGVTGTPIQSRVDLRRRPRQERRAMASGTVPSRPLPRSPPLTRRVEGDENELGFFDPGASPQFLFSETRARPFDREEMLCTVFNIAGAPSCHVRMNICQAQARSTTYSRSTTTDNAGPMTCAVTRYDREDVVDREDIADREDYKGVADWTDVLDQEIGKILPIGKKLPIRNILQIGKMIVLFIFRSNFQ